MPQIVTELHNWTGKFGRDYTDRNPVTLAGLDQLYRRNFGVTRRELNRAFLGKMKKSSRILEVGSNIGMQLALLQKMGFKNLYGIEPQDYAVELSKKRTRGINIMRGNAFDIPFKDGYFDIVFTSGVLIHINPKDVKKAMAEICRTSRRFIWGYEYYSDSYRSILYRGKKGMLWKGDFAKMYLDLFSDLHPVKEKHLPYLEDKNVDTMFLLRKG